MKKTELQAIFDKFAKTSIKNGDDGYFLYGNSVNVQAIDDIWDVYLCNMKEYLHGSRAGRLGTGKLNNIYATLPEDINIHKLDGEGYFQTSDIEWLKEWLDTNRKKLGIKKRKQATVSAFGVR